MISFLRRKPVDIQLEYAGPRPKEQPRMYTPKFEHLCQYNSKLKRKRRINTIGKCVFYTQLLALIGICYYSIIINSRLSSEMLKLLKLNNEIQSLNENLNQKQIQLREKQDVFLNIRKRLYSLDHTKHYDTDDIYSLLSAVITRHDEQQERKDTLQQEIQEMSLAELEKRYGPGPYDIEFTVRFDGQRKYFTIKTAPNELVPHSILTFMSMVESKAWDNIGFFFSPHNTGIAFAADDDDENGVPLNHELTKTLLFPEYSHEFPHVKNTIGFAGRPGGPNFYINLEDNTRIHGPGGQTHHDLSEEGDPCFAYISHGIDIVDLIKDSIKNNRLDLIIESLSL